jgi:hypothetical protein
VNCWTIGFNSHDHPIFFDDSNIMAIEGVKNIEEKHKEEAKTEEKHDQQKQYINFSINRKNKINTLYHSFGHLEFRYLFGIFVCLL